MLNSNDVLTGYIDGETQILSYSDLCQKDDNEKDFVIHDVISPATNDCIFRFATSTPTEIDRAISVAQSVMDGDNKHDWCTNKGLRSRILRNIATELRNHIDRLADLEVYQIGRPRKEMRFQLSRLPEWLEYFSAMLLVEEDTIPPFTGLMNTVQRVPLGVAFQIIPFNHPLLITIKKLAPALAGGNTVLLKPSEFAPASILEFIKLCHHAGLPKGIVQVLLGGKDVVSQVLQDERIAKVDFTGSPTTGRHIGALAGPNLCRITQELGGKAPMVVFGGGPKDNNDLTPMVNGCAFGAFIASGQTCIAGTRILIDYQVYEQFQQELVEKTNVFRMGDPMDMKTTIGPIISTKQMDFINETIHKAITSYNDNNDIIQLKLLCGGKRYQGFASSDENNKLNNGNYYEATIIAAQINNSATTLTKEIMEQYKTKLSELHHNNELFQTELFGPVVVLIPFLDMTHAVELANDSKFSLGCSIWTRDLHQAHTCASRIRAGMIWINDHHKNAPSSPWGGLTKYSGMGRENGHEAYREYTQTKSVITNTNLDAANTDWFVDPNARYN